MHSLLFLFPVFPSLVKHANKMMLLDKEFRSNMMTNHNLKAKGGVTDFEIAFGLFIITQGFIKTNSFHFPLVKPPTAQLTIDGLSKEEKRRRVKPLLIARTS